MRIMLCMNLFSIIFKSSFLTSQETRLHYDNRRLLYETNTNEQNAYLFYIKVCGEVNLSLCFISITL
jgi:hypothetical protein